MPETAVDQKIDEIVDYIIKYGTEITLSGNWITSYDDIPAEICDAAFVADNAKDIADALAGREEVLDILLIDDTFDIIYGLAYCPNLENEDDAALYEQAQEKGYVIAVTDDSDYYLPNAEHIERNDSSTPWLYQDDGEAAKGAERDGIKLIYGMNGIDDGVHIDTLENRKIIQSALQKNAQQERKPSILETLKINAEKSRQQSEPKQDNKKSKEMEM